MRHPRHPVSSLLLGIMLACAGIFLSPRAMALNQADPAPSDETRATLDIDLEAGQRAWRPVLRETVADNVPMSDYPAGVLVALDDPLLLFLEGEEHMVRLAASEAVAMPEATSARAVAMMAETPVKHLTVELVDPASAPDETLDPFDVVSGAYVMSVWHVDLNQAFPDAVAEHLDAATFPMVVYVQAGAIEIAGDDETEAPRQLAAGEWGLVDVDAVVSADPASGLPVLIFVTLDPLPVEEAPPSVTPGGQFPPTSGPIITAPTAAPTAPLAPVPTETPIPITNPPTAPGGNTGGSGTGGVGDVDNPVDLGTFDQTPPAGGVDDVDNPVEPGSMEDDNPGGVGDTDDPAPPIGGANAPPGSTIILGNTGNIPMSISPPAAGSAAQVENPAGEAADDDGDGLTNAREKELGLKPDISDSDNDGLTDGEEVAIHRTNPLLSDTDRDGLGDGWELSVGLLPLEDDGDNDGLLDGEETTTNPRLADSDGDGLLDGDEMYVHGTRPDVYDMDQDCYSDGEEIARGTSPFDGDGYLHCN